MDYDTLIPGSLRQDKLPSWESTLLPLEPTQENSNMDDRNVRWKFTEYFASDIGHNNWQDRYS